MKCNKFHTPILLITFNRPDYVRRVLSEIRRIQPLELYIGQDGPRDGYEHDLGKIVEVRNIISDLVDWPCNLHTLFQEKNLGCGPGPAAAISWFFNNVDRGIILEDDAVPHMDFFQYAEELLSKYEDDDTVCAIGSMKVKQEGQIGDGSYYFSMMNRNLCAWATWKRAWNKFSISLEGISKMRLNSALKRYKCGIIERLYWLDRLEEIHTNCCEGKSWDMQFFMSIWLSRGKGIIPNVNLSSNIGTVDDATHPFTSGNIIENLPAHSILPLVHPTYLSISTTADRQFHYLYFEPNKANWGIFKTSYHVVNRFAKKLLGHTGPWIKKQI